MFIDINRAEDGNKNEIKNSLRASCEEVGDKLNSNELFLLLNETQKHSQSINNRIIARIKSTYDSFRFSCFIQSLKGIKTHTQTHEER